ncbi:MAG: PTS sugar transporter subunit IIA [Parachlamydiales bacterium]
MAILGYLKSTHIIDFLNGFKKKPSSRIFDCLDVQNIVFLKSKNKNEAITELVDSLYNSKKIADKDYFLNKIIEREDIVSSGIGMGVAIPHAKLEGLDNFFIALGIQRKYKIEWDSIDKMPIRIIFLIGGPDKKQNEYLQLLSQLTIVMKDPDLRRNILKSNHPQDVFDQFVHF